MESILKFLLFCESVENRPDGKLHITAPYVSLQLPYIPGVFSFSIIAGFDNFDENPHTVRFELRDKDSRPIIVTEEFNVQMNGTKPTNALKAEMIVNLDFKNLEFKTPGEYHMEVFIDDKPKGGSSLIASQILRGE